MIHNDLLSTRVSVRSVTAVPFSFLLFLFLAVAGRLLHGFFKDLFEYLLRFFRGRAKKHLFQLLDRNPLLLQLLCEEEQRLQRRMDLLVFFFAQRGFGPIEDRFQLAHIEVDPIDPFIPLRRRLTLARVFFILLVLSGFSHFQPPSLSRNRRDNG